MTQCLNKISKYEVRHVNKDVTGVDLDVSLTQRGQLITDETQLDLGLDKRTQKISEGKQADQKSATRNNIQKVQYLMEQLQAKIALRVGIIDKGEINEIFNRIKKSKNSNKRTLYH